MNNYENKCRNRIRELRIARGHNTISDFVFYINNQLGYDVSCGTISLLESHKRENPYWELVDVLAHYFGVTTDYLMGRTNYNVKMDDIEKSYHDNKPLPPEAELAMETFYNKMKAMYAER